jgi:hypothetical protein
MTKEDGDEASNSALTTLEAEASSDDRQQDAPEYGDSEGSSDDEASTITDMHGGTDLIFASDGEASLQQMRLGDQGPMGPNTLLHSYSEGNSQAASLGINLNQVTGHITSEITLEANTRDSDSGLDDETGNTPHVEKQPSRRQRMSLADGMLYFHVVCCNMTHILTEEDGEGDSCSEGSLGDGADSHVVGADSHVVGADSHAVGADRSLDWNGELDQQGASPHGPLSPQAVRDVDNDREAVDSRDVDLQRGDSSPDYDFLRHTGGASGMFSANSSLSPGYSHYSGISEEVWTLDYELIPPTTME